MTATLTINAKVNGTDYGTIGSGDTGNPNSFAQAVSFGAFASGACHFQIRNILVGTTGYGSSDLFAPVLNDLSEFDGIFGNDGSISAATGLLTVSGTGDHYAWKDLSNEVIVYVQFQLLVTAGDGDPDYQDIWSDNTFPPTDEGIDSGIFNGNGVWNMDDDFSDNFGTGPSGTPTWDTIDLRYSYDGPPPTGPFSLAADPNSVSGTVGATFTSTITSTLISGDPEDIDLTIASSLPDGVTAFLSPTTITDDGGTSTLTIETSGVTPAGDFDVDVHGDDGSGGTADTTVHVSLSAPVGIHIAS